MLRFFIWPTVIFVITFFLIRLVERRMVFYPVKYPVGNWNPESFGLKIQDVWLQTKDGEKIHGWFIAHRNPAANLLMAHGNAGNLSNRIEWLISFHEQLPVNLFLFDYRGYGRSEGSPSEAGCYMDANAACDWLFENKPELPVIAHGHSLGGAVVVELARRRELAGLIVEATFTKTEDMSRLLFGPLPVYWFTKMKWDNMSKVATLTLPKLFIHGDRDNIIPHHLGKKLYDAACEPKKFLTLTGSGHNETYIEGGEIYYQTIKEFVYRCTEVKLKKSDEVN